MGLVFTFLTHNLFNSRGTMIWIGEDAHIRDQQLDIISTQNTHLFPRNPRSSPMQLALHQRKNVMLWILPLVSLSGYHSYFKIVKLIAFAKLLSSGIARVLFIQWLIHSFMNISNMQILIAMLSENTFKVVPYVSLLYLLVISLLTSSLSLFLPILLVF